LLPYNEHGAFGGGKSVPVIIANGYIDQPNVYGVIADERGGVTECVRLLAGKRRKHPAFVMNHDTPSNHLKLEGFTTGVRQLMGEAVPRVVRANDTGDGAYEATVGLMRAHPETDAIIYAEDPLAALGLRALRDLEIDVPGSVSVIGINNSFIAEICNPSLTSLDNMLADLSVMAARNLIDVLQGNRVVKRMMLYSHIVERGST
jgi:DNA-binding LacI/PurR family transcriptional regulator